MIFKYKFVTGEEVTIEFEFTPKISAFLMHVDEIESKKERAETRRHESFDEEAHAAPESTENDASRNIDIEAVRKGIECLTPDEQLLVNRLYLDTHKVTPAELAVELGIDPPTVCRRTKRTLKKLKWLILKQCVGINITKQKPN